MNIVLTNNARFNPYTFDEMLKPLAMATQEYNAIEEGLQNLEAEGAEYESYINKEQDKNAYMKYKAFQDNLSRQAELLAKQGLDPSSRRALLQSRAQYKSSIVPIQKAIERRRKLQDEQRNARLKDPTIMFQRNFHNTGYDTSLDRFLENPEYDYGDSYSGELITQQVSKMASHLASQLNPQNIKTGRLDRYTKTLLQQYGLTPEEVMNAIQNPGNAESSRALSAIYNQAMGAIPQSIRDLYPERTRDYATRGFWDALGKTGMSTFDDYEQRLSAEEESQIRRALAKGQDNKGNMIGPRVITGVSGIVNKDLKRLEGLKRLSQGVSTNALDQSKLDLDRAEKAYKDFMSRHDLKKFQNYDSYIEHNTNQSAKYTGDNIARALMTSRAYQQTPEGYSEYKKLLKAKENAQKKYDSEIQFLDSVEEKYKHLGRNRYERIQVGMMLDDLQEKQENSHFALNINESDYNNIRKGIANVLGTLREGQVGGAGLVDDKGKVLSYDDMMKILDKDNIGKLNIKVAGGKDAGIKLIYDGNEYTAKGIEQLDNYNRELKVVDNYLKDFSGDIINYTQEITPDLMQEIKENGINNVTIPANKQKPLGNGFTGLALHDSASGEYIKVLLKDNRIVGINSLSDELTGARGRDAIFMNMANIGLSDLSSLFARD